MSVAHTPGPWEQRHKYNVWAGGCPIATTHGGSKTHSEADARLIAAAPALLEALRCVVRARHVCDAARPSDYCEPCTALDAARAAIAQASK